MEGWALFAADQPMFDGVCTDNKGNQLPQTTFIVSTMASAARSQRPMLAYPNAAPAAVPRVQLLALSPDGEKPPPTFKEIMSKAAKRALGT